MITLKKQTVIILDGPMGSGKTTIATIIHKKIKNLVYLGTDKIKWLQSDFKRNDKEISISIEVILSMMRVYLKNGFHILISENFIDKNARDKFIFLSKNKKVKLFIYHLDAPRKVLLKRISKRSKIHEGKGMLPLSKSFILKNLKLHPRNKYVKAKVIDTSKKPPEEVANLILTEIKKQ